MRVQQQIIQMVTGKWHPTPVLLPGKSHGRRSLVGCSPWGCEELDTTERLHFHFSLSCIGEGNGNPLQCSCLENPRDRGAWWAVVYGVVQSQTRLKRLSSSSSSINAYSLLESKEIKPVNLKGNRPWILFGRTDAEAPIHCPPNVNSWLIGKDPDAVKDWRQKKKRLTEDENWLNGITNSKGMDLGKF